MGREPVYVFEFYRRYSADRASQAHGCPKAPNFCPVPAQPAAPFGGRETQLEVAAVMLFFRWLSKTPESTVSLVREMTWK